MQNRFLRDLGPIWRSLLRNKIGVVLIAVQVAFTMAVCINAFAMIQERIALMDRPSGLAEDELFHLSTTGFGEDYNGLATAIDDLDAIRSTPGVKNAVQINAIPMSGSGWSMSLATEPGSDADGVGAAMYMVDEQGLDTLGVTLIAGENFSPADVIVRESGSSKWPAVGVITAAGARALYPDVAPEDAVGRTLYIDDSQPVQIKGVVAHLQAPWSSSSIAEQALIVPHRLNWPFSRYLVRTEPGMRNELVSVVEEKLANSGATRIIYDTRTMAETRKRSYQLDSGLTRILQFVMVVLLFITACGTLGLASFSVRRRTKQIGTRRALGATRSDVMSYFLLESLLISLVGVTLGALLSGGLNLLLVTGLEFPKIAWGSIPLAMLGLMGLAMLAAYGPARRACNVSPAVATRTI